MNAFIYQFQSSRGLRGAVAQAWDVDGNACVEFGMGNKAIGLGNALPAVVEDVERYLAGRLCQIGCPKYNRPESVPMS